MSLLLRELARTRGDEVALVDGNGTRTWAELDERTDRLIAALRTRGLREGDAVVLLAGNQREAIEVNLACMQGGWLVVPVNWHWVAGELAYVLDDADAAALIVGRAWTPLATEAAAGHDGLRARIAIDDHPPAGFESYEHVLATADPTTAGDAVRGGPMFYTSGTTGFPKGVRGGLATTGGTAEMWQLMAGGLAGMLQLPEHDAVQLVCGPGYHSAQWVFGMFPLLLGATVVLQHRFDAADVLARIDRHRVTNTHLVPAQMIRLLNLPTGTRAAFDGSSLHNVQHGAAPCPLEVKRSMIDWWGPIITEYYGGTEGGFITNIAATEWLTRPGSVGRPLPVVEVLVIDDDGNRLGPGEIGQLYFRSLLGLDFTYHKAPDKTSQAHLEPGVGTLGDVGYLDAEGYLFLCDRKIDLVISGGVNIYPAEIEGVLATHDSVADVAVIGIPHDEMGEALLAVVEVRDGITPDDALERSLDAHCRARLAGYKCPRRWSFVDALPRNEVGKLTKRVLRDPYWADVDRTI